jgi:hypothetical protein
MAGSAALHFKPSPADVKTTPAKQNSSSVSFDCLPTGLLSSVELYLKLAVLFILPGHFTLGVIGTQPCP